MKAKPMTHYQRIGIDDLNGGTYYLRVRWVEQDGGLWGVYDDKNNYIGAIFDQGSKSSATKVDAYDCLAWWEGCDAGPKIGEAKSFMTAVKVLCQWQCTADQNQLWEALPTMAKGQ